jgi:hypothetical protein
MEDLRFKAFTVFLQHTLDAAVAVELVVNQRKQHLDRHTVKASAVWVRYCRSAVVACGAFGLAAIDRAESVVLCWLQDGCSFENPDMSNSRLAVKFEKAAESYSKAVSRQLSGDQSNAALWNLSGALYDQVDAEKIFDFPTDVQYPRDLYEWKLRVLEYDLSAHHHPEISALRSEIALNYHTKIARAEIVAALYVHCKYSAADYIEETDPYATLDVEHLLLVLKYTENALECGEYSETELQALWELCAGYTQAATVELGRAGEKYDAWAWAGDCLAGFAQKLAPAVRLISHMSTTHTSVNLKEVKRQLSDVFQQINESPLVMAPVSDAAQHYSPEPIDKAVEAITLTVQRLVSGSAQELVTIQRFLAAADKVNVDQSPAHPHIKLCWLNAAEQMRLATTASTQKQCDLYKLRSSLQEKLALGPLATAASYFAKASQAITEQSRERWCAAANTVLAAVLPLAERCLLHDPLEANTQRYTAEETTLVERARQLAKFAACGDRVNDSELVLSTHPLYPLHSAELQLRLAVLKWDAASPDDWPAWCTSCFLVLDWCAKLPEMTLHNLVLPGVTPVSAEELLETERGQIGRAVWLCATMTRIVHACTAPDASAAVLQTTNRCMVSLRPALKRVMEVVVTGDSHYCAHIHTVIEALEAGQHQWHLSDLAGIPPVQRRTRQLSAEQYLRGAEYMASYDSRMHTYEQFSKEGLAILRMGAHALQAGRWYVAAVQAQAAAEQQREVQTVFMRAATLASQPDPNLRDATANSDADYNLRLVAATAGERFARAAEALLAGDRETYELWLKAAEGTAHSLNGLRWEGLSAMWPTQDPEALARAAQERQDAADADKFDGGCTAAEEADSPPGNVEVAGVPPGSVERVGQKRMRKETEGHTCVVM